MNQLVFLGTPAARHRNNLLNIVANEVDRLEHDLNHDYSIRAQALEAHWRAHSNELAGQVKALRESNQKIKNEANVLRSALKNEAEARARDSQAVKEAHRDLERVKAERDTCLKALDKLKTRFQQEKKQITEWNAWYLQNKELIKKNPNRNQKTPETPNKSNVAKAKLGSRTENNATGHRVPTAANTVSRIIPYSHVPSTPILIADPLSEINSAGNKSRVAAAAAKPPPLDCSPGPGLHVDLDVALVEPPQILTIKEESPRLLPPKPTPTASTATKPRPLVKSPSDSSDEPVILSERSVKRKRGSAIRAGAQHHEGVRTLDGGVINSMKPKIESNSGTQVLPTTHELIENDSLDLDEVGRTVATPRKRRKVIHRLAECHEEVQNPTPSLRSNINIKSFFASSHQPKRDRTPDVSKSIDKEPPKDDLTRMSAHKRTALLPKNPNLPSLLGTSPKTYTKQKTHRLSTFVKPSIIAEDGDGSSSPDQADLPFNGHNLGTELSRSPANPLAPHLRLSSLLEQPSPRKSSLALDLPKETASLMAKKGTLEPPKSTRNRRPHMDKACEMDSSPPPFHGDGFDSGLPPDVLDSEPFRARPLHRLGLQHFKVNPSYNQGINFAFSETVRNKKLRKCLPGCTKPACCGGAIRKAIELAGPIGLSNAVNTKEDENILLAEYLGVGVGKLPALGESERKERLLQAHTKLFADKYSRHRQAYERRTTPPGFWRADMPTTQEHEQDLAEAMQLERAKVEERYREAMRGGGKWIFLDES
ncbi:MAG: hypothetical protein M1829_000018 [Trizodia sp. TS-e1964]|nr:MAG: hypothetical protein M1829_000018 [Trizodia sp. TS-e1964]